MAKNNYYNDLHSIVTQSLKAIMACVKEVIYNDPVTVINWTDGVKTVVRCQPGDIYDEKTGFLLCVAKRAFGNTGYFNEIMKDFVPGYIKEKNEEGSMKVIEEPFPLDIPKVHEEPKPFEGDNCVTPAAVEVKSEDPAPLKESVNSIFPEGDEGEVIEAFKERIEVYKETHENSVAEIEYEHKPEDNGYLDAYEEKVSAVDSHNVSQNMEESKEEITKLIDEEVEKEVTKLINEEVEKENTFDELSVTENETDDFETPVENDSFETPTAETIVLEDLDAETVEESEPKQYIPAMDRASKFVYMAG